MKLPGLSRNGPLDDRTPPYFKVWISTDVCMWSRAMPPEGSLCTDPPPPLPSRKIGENLLPQVRIASLILTDNCYSPLYKAYRSL